MLNAVQQEQLEAVVQRLRPDLHVEEATLNAQQTLEVVLCNDFVCLRPLRIASQEVDIQAALAGDEEAQNVLCAWLQRALHGVV